MKKGTEKIKKTSNSRRRKVTIFPFMIQRSKVETHPGFLWGAQTAKFLLTPKIGF